MRAGCSFLSAPGKRRSGRGRALAAQQRVLRCGRGEAGPRQALAQCGSVQPRNRKVHASRFNFSGRRHSPERGASAPTPGEEPGETCGRSWGPFLRGGQPPSKDLRRSCLDVLALEPKLAWKLSISSLSLPSLIPTLFRDELSKQTKNPLTPTPRLA